MSIQLPQAAIASFDAQVKHAYQQSGKLRETVRVKTDVVGSTHRFPKMGAGLATRRTPQTDVVPMNITHSNATVTLEDWNAAEYTDVFNEQKTNINERSELAGVIAKAIGRREDQLIIDAMDASGTTQTVATSVGGAASDLNVAKLRSASRILGDTGMGEEEEMHYMGSYAGRESLLAQTETTSTDFNSVRALVNGEINSFMGFQFCWIATRQEGGLDLSANERTSYAYVKSAVGMGVGLDKRMNVDWIAEKTSWLANMTFSAGATAIDNRGIVEVTTTEAA